jgi:hypothetical protein
MLKNYIRYSFDFGIVGDKFRSFEWKFFVSSGGGFPFITDCCEIPEED